MVVSVREIPTSEIKVGERVRRDVGDIEALAQSIRRYGLLHPVVIDQDRNLVAGARRLAAMQNVLGWETVPVREYGELSDLERLEIELEENGRRVDLTASDRTLAEARRFELIEARLVADRQAAAEAAARAAAEQAQENQPPDGESPDGVANGSAAVESFAQSAQNQRRKGGRPPKSESGVAEQQVADEAGVDRRTLQRVREHKVYLDKYGDLIRHLSRDEAISVGETLDKLDARTRKDALKRIGGTLVEHRAVSDIQKALREMSREQRDREAANSAAQHSEEIERTETRRSWHFIERALRNMVEVSPEEIAAALDDDERAVVQQEADTAITWLARLSRAVRPEFQQEPARDSDQEAAQEAVYEAEAVAAAV